MNEGTVDGAVLNDVPGVCELENVAGSGWAVSAMDSVR